MAVEPAHPISIDLPLPFAAIGETHTPAHDTGRFRQGGVDVARVRLSGATKEPADIRVTDPEHGAGRLVAGIFPSADTLLHDARFGDRRQVGGA